MKTKLTVLAFVIALLMAVPAQAEPVILTFANGYVAQVDMLKVGYEGVYFRRSDGVTCLIPTRALSLETKMMFNIASIAELQAALAQAQAVEARQAAAEAAQAREWREREVQAQESVADMLWRIRNERLVLGR